MCVGPCFFSGRGVFIHNSKNCGCNHKIFSLEGMSRLYLDEVHHILQNGRQLSSSHAQKVLCRGWRRRAGGWAEVGLSVFLNEFTSGCTLTAAHLPCLKSGLMCSTFCNNLIYKAVFLPCAPRSKFVKNRVHSAQLLLEIKRLHGHISLKRRP